MTLRRRLILTVIAVATVALGGAFVTVFEAVYLNQQRQLDSALLAEAREEAQEAASIGGRRLAIIDGPGPLANDIGPLTKFGAIYDAGGSVVDATETFRHRPPGLDEIRHKFGNSFDTSFDAERLRAVLVPVPGGDGAMLLLAAPRWDLDRDAAFLFRAMVSGFAIAVAWAALVVTWIVRRLTRGHEAIAAVVRRVADGDLTARVESEITRGDPAQLASDVNNMIHRLSALLSSQQEFIVHAAHELRSPLTLLYGELSLAARRSRDADEYRRAIDEALLAARSLKVLAEDLLALARIDAAIDQPLEEVKIGDIIQHVVGAVGPTAADRHVAIKVTGVCRSTRGRERDLARVVRNVLENAIRHSPDGGLIEIDCGDREALVVVTISDQGRGVPAEDRDRIFQPFYRGPDELSNLPGFGMGLAIARKLARAFGGDVVIGHPRSAGAHFIITLVPS
jgi:two-component system, OmpR family, sensor kinase